MMTYVRLAMAASMIAMLAGCSFHADQHDQQVEGIPQGSTSADATGDHSAPPSMPSHDPPLGFQKAFQLDGPVAYRVKGDLLYAVWGAKSLLGSAPEPRIAVISMVTGDELASVRLASEVEAPTEGLRHSMTAFVDIGGQMSLMLAYEYKIEGAGTIKDRTILRIRADRAETGALIWSTDIDISDNPIGAIYIPATSDEYALITSYKHRTMIVRIDSGKVVHDWPGFRGYAIVDDVVVGWYKDGRTGFIEGRSISAGQTLWNRQNIDTDDDWAASHELGNGYVLHSTPRDGGLIIAAATGATLQHVGEGRSRIYCKYDEAGLVVCADGNGEFLRRKFLVAYNLNSGEQLWSEKDIGQGRTIPLEIDCIYRGVAYMSFSKNYRDDERPPMVLDVRTGADLVEELPTAMEEVGAGYGISQHWNLRRDSFNAIVVYMSTR
ncbi:hypothetical protein AB0M79_35080 [Polymorphospora sp. NPDC051019]|uniref:hypothetical protein n=1 Tax=Polymorphospora sp. NPDC051019 TaxID=3155725 RepID=UPI00343B9A90